MKCVLEIYCSKRFQKFQTTGSNSYKRRQQAGAQAQQGGGNGGLCAEAWSGTPNVIQQGGGVGVDGLACGPGDNG